jgi:prepilin-type N-terminal cleavage/methylation domain-containing protein/prepilin-type processing-associated H-X9-DG protein
MKRIAVIGTMTNNCSPAFTLIESLVVMATIGIMAAIAVPVFNGVAESAKATKDLVNLLHIGTATQLYMNDNNGTLFSTSTTDSWMSQLYPKYISSWNTFVSPFDHRTSVTPSLTSAVSYGINGTQGVVGMSADRISKPTAFIVFAPAQGSQAAANFAGTADTLTQTNSVIGPSVTVVRDRAYPTPSPTPTATPPPVQGGTHRSRTKINAVFADWHVETMDWSAFKDTAAPYRWDP